MSKKDLLRARSYFLALAAFVALLITASAAFLYTRSYYAFAHTAGLLAFITWMAWSVLRVSWRERNARERDPNVPQA